QGSVRLVPRPAPLRDGAARRLRPGLRAHRRVRDRALERARRDSLPAHAGQRPLLTPRIPRRYRGTWAERNGPSVSCSSPIMDGIKRFTRKLRRKVVYHGVRNAVWLALLKGLGCDRWICVLHGHFIREIDPAFTELAQGYEGSF